MAKRDYYQVLGVDQDADEAMLKSAYRKLALQHHPDRNQGDPAAEDRFKEASEAYAVLSDAQKRAKYDRFGFDGVNMGGGGGFQDFGDLGNFGDIFNDLFGDIFGRQGGGGRSRGRGQRGADLRYNLDLELSDVLEGKEAHIEIPKTKPCVTCDSTGAKPGTRPETCPQCRGAGQVILQQGFFRISRPCDVCAGAGEIVRERCPDCLGAGRTEGMHAITVKVPPGVEDGTRLRVTGEGEAGIAGGGSGDLYVVLSIIPHPLFEREGRDIHCQVPIAFVKAALGGEVEVPTLYGKVSLRIPEGTQSGKIMRMRGKGVPSLRTRSPGDQHVHIFVEVPTKLTKKQRDLLQQFADESGTEVSPVTKGFLDKLRNLID